MMIFNQKGTRTCMNAGIMKTELGCHTVELVAILLSCRPAWWSSVCWFCHFHQSFVPEESH